jgi:hypothetical protein
VAIVPSVRSCKPGRLILPPNGHFWTGALEGLTPYQSFRFDKAAYPEAVEFRPTEAACVSAA